MIINFSNIGGNSGGGGGGSTPSASNYRIVDALSSVTNPTEGLMVYVRSGEIVHSGVRLQVTDCENFQDNDSGQIENYIGWIHWGDWSGETQSEDELQADTVYQSGNNFYWSFENDGNFRNMKFERDGGWYKFQYRTYNHGESDGCGAWIEFYPVDTTPWGDFIVSPNDGCSTSVTQYTEIVPGGTFVYSHSAWTKVPQAVYVWDGMEPSASAETTALYNEVKASVERGVYPSVLYKNHFLDYEGMCGDHANFYGIMGGNSEARIYISSETGTFGGNGFNEAGVRIDEAQLDDNNIYAYNWLNVDYSGNCHGDYSCVSYGTDNIWKVWFKIGEDETIIAPISWRHFYDTEIDGETRRVWVFGGDIPFSTDSGIELWRGVWSVLDGDWYEDNAHTLSWTQISGPFVDSTYPVYVESPEE